MPNHYLYANVHKCTTQQQAQKQHGHQRAIIRTTVVIHDVPNLYRLVFVYLAETQTPSRREEIRPEWALFKKSEKVAEGVVKLAGGSLR